jgi:heme-degrading monooxygenase HmoA
LFVIIWKFIPKRGLEKQFEEVYGPHGLWIELFSKTNDYLGTSLLREVDSENIYLAVDRWNSKETYDAFKLRFFEEYHLIDLQCKQLTQSEEFVGAYKTKAKTSI